MDPFLIMQAANMAKDVAANNTSGYSNPSGVPDNTLDQGDGSLRGGSGGGIQSGLSGLMKKLPSAGQMGQLAFGAGQALAGYLKKKKGEAMTPMAENPMERQMLSTIQRRRKALQSGTAYNSQMSANKQLGKTLMTNSMRAGGTPNFGQYNQLIGNAAKEIASQYGGQLNQLLGAEQQQTTSMANRATDIQLLQRAQLMADAANLQKSGSSNLLAAMGAGKLEKQNNDLTNRLALMNSIYGNQTPAANPEKK
jgi:hypothetical protein